MLECAIYVYVEQKMAGSDFKGEKLFRVGIVAGIVKTDMAEWS